MIRSPITSKPTKRKCKMCPETVAHSMDKYCSIACAKKDREQTECEDRRESRAKWKSSRQWLTCP